VASVLGRNVAFSYEQFSLSVDDVILVILILVVAEVKVCLHIVLRHCLIFNA